MLFKGVAEYVTLEKLFGNLANVMQTNIVVIPVISGVCYF
jgi:hypothetical protein